MSLEIGPNLLALLIAVGVSLTPIFAAIAAWFARKANEKATSTHELVNSRMTELLEVTRSNARAEGVAAGGAGELPTESVTVATGHE